MYCKCKCKSANINVSVKVHYKIHRIHHIAANDTGCLEWKEFKTLLYVKDVKCSRKNNIARDFFSPPQLLFKNVHNYVNDE